MTTRISRRQFLIVSSAAAAGALAGCTSKGGDGSPAAPPRTAGIVTPGTSPALAKFVDPLPFPSVIKPEPGSSTHELAAMQFSQQLHRDLDPTRVFGFNGSFPGPTIEARSGQPIRVTWTNRLPEQHMFEIDTTLHGAEANQPGGRMVVHLHGGHVPAASDGYPEHWTTPGESVTYEYPNNQVAAPLWYHDHVLGMTRLNVYAGLFGLYLIRDEEEDALDLPSGDYEIPLVIQDRIFTSDGQLWYPPVNPDRPGHVWVPEFFGDTIIVNGKVWPYLEVEPRPYRFRIYDGSNARFYNLKLSNGSSFKQIGAEAGLFAEPAEMDTVLIAPGERADVIVDFTGLEEKQIVLSNDANAPYPDGDAADLATNGTIMQFRVTKRLSDTPVVPIPGKLRAAGRIPEKKADVTRQFFFIENVTADDNPKSVQINGKDFDDPIDDRPVLGDTEIWELINPTADAHPIHLHLVHFQLLDRRPFDTKVYENTGKVQYTGPAKAPDPNEMGNKDTVRTNPGEVTRIIQTFEDYAGKYPWHCHILEHEDNSMMLQFETVEK